MMDKQSFGRKPIQRKSIFYVYIVKCTNGSYYTGYTNNLENRIKLHNNGSGAKYLRGKLPVKLIYAKKYKYYKTALNEERRIKQMRKEQKTQLINIYEKK
ncbi:MAG: GIY-YIG nuclease family protein [Elusimicrobiota bacterium]